MSDFHREILLRGGGGREGRGCMLVDGGVEGWHNLLRSGGGVSCQVISAGVVGVS